MADTAKILENLQADVFAMLKATPGLALANIIADNEGDIEAKVAKALATLTPTGGKNGLAVVILLPEIVKAEENLPGPPLTVKLEIRTLENVLLNRAAATGTLMRSSEAALRVLSTLHHAHLGDCFLAAEKDPVTAVEVKKGHVSHAVTLFVRFSGFVTQRPLPIKASLLLSANVNVSGTLSPDITGTYIDHDEYQETWTKGISPNICTLRVAATQTLGLYIWTLENSAQSYYAEKYTTATSPMEIGVWEVQSGTGQPVITAAMVLQLTCASAGATIRYTTDGSYPSPSKTLYTAPLLAPVVGTVFRAAAYVAGMPPGDVLEFTIKA